MVLGESVGTFWDFSETMGQAEGEAQPLAPSQALHPRPGSSLRTCDLTREVSGFLCVVGLVTAVVWCCPFGQRVKR